jgi:hypothetical protein
MTPRDSSERANKLLQDRFHRCSLEYYNRRLDDIEEEIINVMRIDSWQASELVHCLVGERENTKELLKDLHFKLYGKDPLL